MSAVEIEVRVRYRRGFSEQVVMERTFVRYERAPTIWALAHLAQMATQAAELLAQEEFAAEVKANDG